MYLFLISKWIDKHRKRISLCVLALKWRSEWKVKFFQMAIDFESLPNWINELILYSVDEINIREPWNSSLIKFLKRSKNVNLYNTFGYLNPSILLLFSSHRTAYEKDMGWHLNFFIKLYSINCYKNSLYLRKWTHSIRLA